MGDLHPGQGGLHPGEGGLHPGVLPWRGGLHPVGSTGGFCIQGGSVWGRVFIQGSWTDPSQSDATGYGQRAGGMHPTGMHSCNLYDFTISGYGRFEFEH